MTELQSDLAKVLVKGTTKRALRKSLIWNEAESTYADSIGKLCKEWLFPCFKFLHEKKWMDYSDGRKSLPTIIFRCCPVPANKSKVDMWDRVVVPTVQRNMPI